MKHFSLLQSLARCCEPMIRLQLCIVSLRIVLRTVRSVRAVLPLKRSYEPVAMILFANIEADIEALIEPLEAHLVAAETLGWTRRGGTSGQTR